MKATIVDLRYKMNEVLKALDRNEKVTIFYHGKEKGIIIPKSINTNLKVKDHPFFGMFVDEKKSVEEQIESLRGNRYNDI